MINVAYCNNLFYVIDAYSTDIDKREDSVLVRGPHEERIYLLECEDYESVSRVTRGGFGFVMRAYYRMVIEFEVRYQVKHHLFMIYLIVYDFTKRIICVLRTIPGNVGGNSSWKALAELWTRTKYSSILTHRESRDVAYKYGEDKRLGGPRTSQRYMRNTS